MKGAKEMELQVKEFSLPKVIEFNYEELKDVITAKTSYYETLVYNDNQIKDAKSDRSELNKFKKALNDERIRREKEYLAPFQDFKDKVNELIAIIDKPVAVIDRQIKEYEENERKAKRAEIEAYFNGELREDITTIPPEWLKLDAIFIAQWLNKSYSMAGIKDDIKAKVKEILESLVTLADLPEYGYEATEVYKTSLDMNKAINEARRMADIQKAKEAALKAKEAEKAQNEAEIKPEIIEPKPTAAADDKEPVRGWVSFAAYLSADEARALNEFLVANGIQFKRV